MALASFPFMGRGSVLVDIGMPAGDRPPYYAAEYVYAMFDHVQVVLALSSVGSKQCWPRAVLALSSAGPEQCWP